MMHFKTLGLAALLVTGAGLASPANAAPLSLSSSLGLTSPQVETVAFGCGPGWAPNRWGDCRPMYRRYGYYRPYGGYGAYGGYGGYGYARHDYIRPVIHVGPYGGGISFR